MSARIAELGYNNWEAIRMLERLARLTHRRDRISDAANILKLLFSGLRSMARAGMFTDDITWFDRLEALETRLEPAIVDTQSDPAAIVAICFHVLLSNVSTCPTEQMVLRRARLSGLIDAILRDRFQPPSADDGISSKEAKLRRLRTDLLSIPLTVEELGKAYLSDL